MKLGASSYFRRSVMLAAACILAVVLTACTGKGGGYLPPQGTFTGQASFGFTFSCEKGDLKTELSYNDKGSNAINPISSSFGIHGIVDRVEPVLQSAVCIDENPPPPPENQLIFLGRYYLTSSAPAGFPSTCPTRETSTSPLCRFQVIVQDNDGSMSPSQGDFFSITLSTATGTCTDFSCSQLPPTSVVYTRAGYLAGGNITVK
jgi:predicted small lipoprotein YifL